MGTKYQMRQQGSSFTVTTTHEDDDGKPLDGITETFNSQQEAEDYMAHKTDKKTDTSMTPIDDNTMTAEDIQAQNATGTDEQGREKPASQMTEADAVALNSDVHLAVPGESPRIVTEGQMEQVDAGLHPDATEGRPLMKDDGNDSQQQVEPSEDLHVREPSK